MEIITMRQLLESGVHFGHQTKRWNPKMKKYIFTSRNGIHVIDLQQTIKLIRKSYEFAKDVAKRGGTVLFVGTKKQAQEAIQFESEAAGMPFVNHRWLGGTLTNLVTVRQSVNKFRKYLQMEEDGIFKTLSGKEAARKQKTLHRLKYNLEGIKNMGALPSALFIVDTKREQLAVDEANKLGIPIIGIVDTNADPTEVQYPIPANDDAIRAIKLLCSIMSKAVIDGRAEMGQAAPIATQEEVALETMPILDEEIFSEEVLERMGFAEDFEEELVEEAVIKPKKERVKKAKAGEEEV